MRQHVFYLTFVLIILSCSEVDPEFDSNSDIAKGDIKLISYGLVLQDPPHLSKFSVQLDSLQKHYGFYFENRGCNVDSISLIKMKAYNSKIIEYLTKKHGANWYEKYRRQVDSINQIKLEFQLNVEK